MKVRVYLKEHGLAKLGEIAQGRSTRGVRGEKRVDCCKMWTVALVLVALQVATASYATLSRPSVSTLRPISMAVVMEDTSFAKEILDDAKNEEEQEFDAAIGVMTAQSRSAEAIAELRKAADAHVAALRDADKPSVTACLTPAGRASGGKLREGAAEAVGDDVARRRGLRARRDLARRLRPQRSDLPLRAVSRRRVRGRLGVGAGCAGNLGAEALNLIAAEQELARGNFPARCPRSLARSSSTRSSSRRRPPTARLARWFPTT